jgi:hypothetical protein
MSAQRYGRTSGSAAFDTPAFARAAFLSYLAFKCDTGGQVVCPGRMMRFAVRAKSTRAGRGSRQVR